MFVVNLDFTSILPQVIGNRRKRKATAGGKKSRQRQEAEAEGSSERQKLPSESWPEPAQSPEAGHSGSQSVQ